MKHALPPELRELVEHLPGADEGTVGVVEALRARGGLPAAAFYLARECLASRRERPPRLRNEAGYFVAALKTMQREGRYA